MCRLHSRHLEISAPKLGPNLAWENAQDFFYKYVPGFTETGFARIEQWYDEWGLVIVLLAGFSPIPYKIFTIASGALSMTFLPFVLASAASRSARFFLVALLLAWFGEPMKDLIDRHFNKLALIFSILLVGGFVAVKYWFKH